MDCLLTCGKHNNEKHFVTYITQFQFSYLAAQCCHVYHIFVLVQDIYLSVIHQESHNSRLLQTQIDMK